MPSSETPDNPDRRPRRAFLTARKRLGRLAAETPRGSNPVSPEVLEVGRFVNSHILNPERLAYLGVYGSGANISEHKIYSAEEVVELEPTFPKFRPKVIKPVAHALLTITGNNYNWANPHGPDGFYCKLGVTKLNDGARVIQAVPYEWESASGEMERRGMRVALRELFGDNPEINSLEKFERIILGTLDEKGGLAVTRPFNNNAFGIDFVPILDRLSSPETPGDIHFGIQGNILTDYTEQKS